MRMLRSFMLCAAALLAFGAGQAQAASLTITASPASVPAGGGTVTVTEVGHADRDGQLIVYYQHASSACQATSENERNYHIGVGLNDRTNIAAGENFTETAQFDAQPGISYRVCGYLSGDNDTVPPDVRADRPICASGTHLSSNRCVSNTTARSALGLFAPARANGFFRVTLTWTATASDHTVFLYAQPARIACYRTGEDERNHGYRRIRTIYYRAINGPGRYSKTLRLKESPGGKTRLCAYLYGFNDVGSPTRRKSAVVG